MENTPMIIIMLIGLSLIGESMLDGCIIHEQDALLKFKSSLSDPSDRLASWHINNTNCCTWEGIVCENITGHVISLSVGSQEMMPGDNPITDGYGYYDGPRLHGKNVDSSLSELRHLSYLDLSSNDFGGSMIPAFLGSLEHLQHLLLSNANFTGAVPDHLGNLSRLVSIDLSENKLSGSIPTSVGNLSLLTGLYLQFNEFSGTIPVTLCNLRNLEVLSLYSNQLSGSIPSYVGNFSLLRELHMGSNKFNGTIPSTIEYLRALRVLSLDNNQIQGHIPQNLGNLSSLEDLSLMYNQLSDEIPFSLGQLSNLNKLSLGSNLLSSTIVEAHFANLSKLTFLDLSPNFFINFTMRTGWVPPFQLEYLFLSSCEIGGQFPEWLKTQKNLGFLDLSSCNIFKAIPDWFREMSVRSLDLSDNQIEGPMENLPFAVSDARLSNNSIKYLPNNMGNTVPQLSWLELAENSLTGPIPDSFCKLDFMFLELSGNSLSGNLPYCWANISNLRILRLSRNILSGVLNPESLCGSRSLEWLFLNNNRFTGLLPSTSVNCSGLQTLDIGNNMISGELPKWVGLHLLDLKVLKLRNNHFNSSIPFEFCQLSNLMVLDLANNKLTGNIPHCFNNFSNMVMHGSTRPATDYRGTWGGEGMTEVLKGSEMEYNTERLFLVDVDLSNNYLVGGFPSELTNLSALITLNLSNNHLKGEIPQNIRNMKSLISLDLSSNNLFGYIPQSLSELNSLSYLNLSYNNFSGPIPTGRQIQTIGDEHPSIYDGNPGLCGAPLQKTCHAAGKAFIVPDVETHVDEDEEDKNNDVLFYGISFSGFATGFWGIIIVLIFQKRWRNAFFQLVEVKICRLSSAK